MRAVLARLLGAAVAGAVALAVGAATPAHATDTWIDATFTGGAIGLLPAPTKNLPIRVQAHDAQNLQLVITLENPRPGGSVAMQAPAGCTQTADVFTCQFGTVGDLDRTLQLSFRATANAQAGDGAVVHYTVSADGYGPYSNLNWVSVKDSFDLVAGVSHVTARRGVHASVPVSFANLGSQTFTGVHFDVFFNDSLLPDTYANCTYSDYYYLDIHEWHAACDYPGSLAPGDRFTLTGGFGVTVALDSVPDPVLVYNLPVFGSVPPGSTQNPPQDNDLNDNQGTVYVTVPRTPGGNAMGGAAPGRAGHAVESVADAAIASERAAGTPGASTPATSALTGPHRRWWEGW